MQTDADILRDIANNELSRRSSAAAEAAHAAHLHAVAVNEVLAIANRSATIPTVTGSSMKSHAMLSQATTSMPSIAARVNGWLNR